MSNRTPGEWTVGKNMGEEPVVVSANHHDNGGFVICRTYGRYKHGNAVLISATKELLAALRDLLSVTEPTYDNRHERQAAVDAIAKATGDILEDNT